MPYLHVRSDLYVVKYVICSIISVSSNLSLFVAFRYALDITRFVFILFFNSKMFVIVCDFSRVIIV